MYVRGGDKKRKAEYEILCKIKKVLIEESRMIRYGDWNQADIEILNKHLFITAKSMIYLVNLSEKDFMRKKNKWLPKIKEYIDKNDPGATVIPFSGTFEQKLTSSLTMRGKPTVRRPSAPQSWTRSSCRVIRLYSCSTSSQQEKTR